MPQPPTRPPSSSDRLFDRASRIVLAVLVLIVAFTFDDYGITWDESYHTDYGDHIIAFYTSGFEDQTAVTFRIDYLYGGGFDAMGSLWRSLGFQKVLGKFEAMHLMGALIGVLGIAGTWKLGRELAGPRAGFIACVVMATVSVYYGHMFNNPKDLPFAAGYAWGLYYLFALIKSWPSPSRGLLIKSAIAFGLAMSVRIGGLLLVCYLALAIGAWIVHRGWTWRSAEQAYHSGKKVIGTSVLMVAGAWLVMLVWWPWALYDPIRRPLAALTRMSQFIDHRRHMLFDGEQVYNLEPPWDYLLHYFGYKLPEYVVVLGVAATLFGIVALVMRRRLGIEFQQWLIFGLLGLSVWFPPVYAVYKESPLYDGLRHFLFLIPPIVAMVAVLVEHVLREAKKRWSHRGEIVVWALFSALVADQAATMVRYHPQQYVYFNRFIGGLEGAWTKYDTDYYAQTYKESAERLAEALWKDEPHRYLNSMYRVSGCSGKFRALHYLPPNFVWGSKANREFFLGYTRGGCSESHRRSPIISEVQRDGGRLNVARDLRQVLVPAERDKRRRSKKKPRSKAKALDKRDELQELDKAKKTETTEEGQASKAAQKPEKAKKDAKADEQPEGKRRASKPRDEDAP